MKAIILILIPAAILCLGQKIYLRDAPPFSKKAPNPEFRPHVKHPLPISPIWGSLKGPLPTTSWYQNFVVQSGCQPINLHPFMIRL